MTSDRIVRVCVLIALVAVSLEARGSQEVRQDVRIATAVGGVGVAPAGAPSISTPLSPITSTGTGLIVGRVIDAGTGRPVGGALVSIGGSAPPAPGRTVVMNAPGGQPVTFGPSGPSMPRLMTDSEGRFVFRNLPKGAFNLTAVKPGYVDGAYGRLRPNGASQSLELGEGERLNDLTIRVFRFATISGVVSDQTGDPAVAVQVRAYRRGLSGGRRILSPAGTSMTDDRGAYRLFNLIPGEYVVSVPSVQSSVPANMQLGGRMSPDLIATAISGGSGEFSIGTGGTQVGSDGRFLLQPGMRGSTGTAPDASGRLLVHQTAYHPSASTVGQAQPVTVASGDDRSGVDVALKLVPSATISGRLLGPTGPAESYMLHLTPTDTGEMSTDPDVATAVTAADGSFMFFGVPAGQYVIQTLRAPRTAITGAATMMVNQGSGNMSFTSMTLGGAGGPAAPPTNTEPTLWTATPVTLGATDIGDLTINLNTGLKISGRTEFQGAAERPPGDRLAQVTVMLESADGRSRTGTLPARLQANGLFTTAGVPPGKYLLRVINPPGGWDVRSIMLGGVDASDTPIDFEDKDLAGAVITFSDRVSALSGTVKSTQGAVDNAAAVVIFPTDNRAWTYNNARRVRMTRASKSGTYTFNGLPEGDYFLIAIPEEVASEWQDPRFLEAMSREATRVTIVEGDKRTQDLERRNIRPVEGRDLAAVVIAGPGQPSPRLRRSAQPPRVSFSARFGGPPKLHAKVAVASAEAEGPAYTEPQSTQQQQTRDPRATPARDRAADPAGTGAIAGVVLQDDASNTPMRRARVTLRRSEGTAERATMTDDSGRFSFAALPEGRYTLLAGKAAYLTVYHGAARAGRGPGSPIALAAGQQLGNLVVRMPRGAVVTGMVSDQFGAPVPNVGVRFMQSQMSGGERRLMTVPAPGSVTDDRGIYRAYGLMPGNYVVSVVPPPQGGSEIRQLSQSDLQAAMNDMRQQPGAAAPARPAGTPADAGSAIVPGRSVGYAPVYYPGTTVQAEAGQVTVGPGQELTGIDLSMRLVPTSKLAGTVLGVDGRPAAGSMVMALPADSAAAVSSRSTQTDQEGKFSLPNVAPGRYTLISRGGGPGAMAMGERMVILSAPPGIGGPPGAGMPPPPPPPPPPGASPLYAEQELDVSGEDISGLSLTLQPGMTVSGRIVFESKTGATPPDFNQIRVILSNASPNRVTMGTPPGQVDSSGNFAIQGVPPGQYRFGSTVTAPGASGPGWTLKSAMAGGRDTLDTPLEVRPGGNVEGVTITYSDLVSEISGTLSDGKGKPISDLSILVFTTDRSLWGTPSRRLRQPTQPSSDGKFRITGLPAGEYFLGAVTDLEPGDWQDPAFLEQLSAAAIKMTIADGEKKVQDIKIAGG
ncbi:MAG TPA: carboxypeptidase-like regulatory domain-containing protein [Vicinamibacterales bacterium]|nr:carboxypeptidase-like regulatory domain-containing protein [Vicinamibacterales bacterium]